MKIDIKGVIIDDDEQLIYDWFGIPAISPNKVKMLLEKNPSGETIEILINSGGGSVFAGSEIYTMLKEAKDEVITKVVGVAASAASVIAMGGSEVQMTPTGQIMIHNSSSRSSGDHRTLNHSAELLRSVDSGIASAYEIKTGLKNEELLSLMAKETWLNSEKAKELGFIDTIMFKNEIRINNSLTNEAGLLPVEVIEKVRNEIFNKNNNNKSEFGSSEVEASKAKLRLKLKLNNIGV